MADAAGGNQSHVCSGAGVCRPGLMLPVWMPQTNVSLGETIGRAAVYFLALCYCFLGVSIVSDRFMAAIEVVTSKERSVKLKKITGEEYTVLVRVWNETVSNLTLMALGSSAPEILLSIIEVVGNGFEAGELGPGTIVGSAAFNLYVIIGICVSVIPGTEIRRIKHITVFWVTCAWSLFAYVWLFLIIGVITPGVIQVWEGVLTFLFFPLTVLTAYVADRRLFGILGSQRLLPKNRPVTAFSRGSSAGRRGTGTKVAVKSTWMGGSGQTESARSSTEKLPAGGDVELNGDLSGSQQMRQEVMEFENHRQRYIEVFKELRAEHPEAPIDVLERKAEEKIIKEGPKSRAFYRIQATRKLTGGGDLIAKRVRQHKSEMAVMSKGSTSETPGEMGVYRNHVVAYFDPGCYTCMENVGTMFVTVAVDRGGVTQPCIVEVDYRTMDGTAQSGSDYKSIQGTVVFQPTDSRKNIGVDIIDNDVYEEDEQFTVVLQRIRVFAVKFENGRTVRLENVPDGKDIHGRLQTPNTATVIIVDNDHAGAFGFENEKYEVAETDGEINLTVVRTRGARGIVSVPYKTVDGRAKAGQDYKAAQGVLFFRDEQSTAAITIEVINDDEYEKSEDFFVELDEPLWDGQPDEEQKAVSAVAEDGRPILSAIPRCKIIIKESKEFKSFVDKMMASANASLAVGTSSWKQQFQEAISIDGSAGDGDDDETPAEPSLMDIVMHALTLPWKLLFALIPPTDYMSGWLCFVVSIIGIGLMTAIIGDVASHFGCTIGLKDSVTAIAVVALGTSLPDTFASKTAATQDAHADASVGNVTGSNAVNVFLGIGIAWAMAAIVHAIKGTSFKVQAGSLAFSVTIFLAFAVICVIVLQVRRRVKSIHGELGGPTVSKFITSAIFIGLWFLYVIISALEAYCIIPGF